MGPAAKECSMLRRMEAAICSLYSLNQGGIADIQSFCCTDQETKMALQFDVTTSLEYYKKRR